LNYLMTAAHRWDAACFWQVPAARRNVSAGLVNVVEGMISDVG
jgi:hypothetical protein